ncbi:uncharacterized protein K02A2.6-like [Ochlerotatus camptorhynchus]|uniref:uncharacterized protein K02A2.6-like n=1 Tax=Ochlerotatus camptorhynchus TaxID=644619 RepID=UPI0031DC6523
MEELRSKLDSATMDILEDREEYDSGTECIIRAVQESAAIDIAEVITATASDPELQKLIEFITNDSWNQGDLKEYMPFRLEFSYVNNLVMRGTKLVIPKGLRSRMCQLAHEGHPGQSMMKRRLRERCWWPVIDKDAIKTCETCEGCQLVQTSNPPEPMMRRILPEKPWVDVAIDFLGPMPTGEYLLVIVDYFSRYMEIEVMQRITAQETIKRLKRIFRTWGPPRTITLDNAKQFVSTEFEDFSRNIGVHLNHTSPYWPQANGEVQRQNRSLLKRMKIAHALYDDWKVELDSFLELYNNTPHTITGKAPSELLQGRKLRSKLPQIEDFETTPPSSDFRDRDFEKKMLQKEREDTRRRAKPSDISVGDVVLMKNLLPSNKLATNFLKEKFTVLSRIGSNVTVQSNDTGKKYDRNVSHLKRLSLPSDDNIDESSGTGSQPEAEPSSSSAYGEDESTIRRPQRVIKPRSRYSPTR